ncbi:MAG: murein biosynthesis integral membrane protein MurJ [Anaerolineae bacterium]|nr:murein biosynthesis integral membrane protein MurJ [Anaerolineae bacterium]
MNSSPRTRFLLQSSVIVMVLFGLDKLLGLARTILVSREFGTGEAYDAFTAANQLPEVFVALISGGALAAAFIPVYSAYLNSERARQSAQLANATLTLVFLILAAISATGILLAPYIIHLLVPEYSLEQQALTASLMRIILVQTTIFGVSGVLSSILNAHQHFILPALAPSMLHAGYLFGLFVLVPEYGIHGLAWGTVVGGLLHVAIQLPGLRRHGFRYRPLLGLELAGVREIIRLMGPRMVTLGAVQTADLFLIRILSGLDEGSTSAYFYGYYLQQLPETLLGTAIAIVVFPTLAEMFNAGNREGLKQTATAALRIIWTLTVPAAAAMILLGQPAIRLVLERGAFDANSTLLVYRVLVFFSVRIVSEATLEIVARLFYAQHDTVTPMLIKLGWLFTHVVLAYALVGPLGLGGIALSASIAFTLESGVLLYLNHRQLGGLVGYGLFYSLARAVLSAAVMSGVILLVRQVVSGDIVYLAAALPLGLIVYFLVSRLLGGEEIPLLLRLLRRKG